MDKSVSYVNKYFPMPNPLWVWIEKTCYPSWTGQQVTEYLLQVRCCQAVGSPQGDQNQCCLEETQKSKEESWEQINYRTVPHAQQYKTLSRKVQRWHREGSGYMFKGPRHVTGKWHLAWDLKDSQFTRQTVSKLLILVKLEIWFFAWWSSTYLMILGDSQSCTCSGRKRRMPRDTTVRVKCDNIWKSTFKIVWQYPGLHYHFQSFWKLLESKGSLLTPY